MDFDRLRRHVESLRDVTVGLPAGREIGNAALAGGVGFANSGGLVFVDESAEQIASA